MSRANGPPTPPEGVTTVVLDRWAAGGRALGRVDGRVWMVAGGAPGDEVLARPLKDHGRYVEAVAEAVVTASRLRREPPCALQAVCGGCPLMVVDEAAQHEAKRRFVIDALERIGRLGPVAVGPVVAIPPSLAYRNKIELTFGRGPHGERVLGYHRSAAPADLVDVPACRIADDRLQTLLVRARSFFLDGPGRDDPALSHPHEPLRLVLRASGSSLETLIAFRSAEGPFPSLASFARSASEAEAGLAGVVRILAVPGRRGGGRVEAVVGRAWLEESILGVSFRLPATAFFQVHAAAAEALARQVVEGAGAPRSVIELYGGVGGIGLALARRGAAVTIVEADAGAVACGAEAADRAGLGGARFVRADVLRFLRAGSKLAAPDLIVADPPRSGLGPGVARSLGDLGAHRIAMVSCDPATLARDVAALAAAGYTLERVIPFDLFPQTAHVEAVAWLTRSARGAEGA